MWEVTAQCVLLKNHVESGIKLPENTFVSLGINLGTDRYTDPRLTLSAQDVAGIVQHLNDLNEEDPVEGTSPIGDVLAHINTIDAAVNVARGLNPNNQTGNAVASAPAAPPAEVPTCQHGAMRFRSGTTKAGPNAGKQYEAYFCTAPMGPGQCKPVNFKYL